MSIRRNSPPVKAQESADSVQIQVGAPCALGHDAKEGAPRRLVWGALEFGSATLTRGGQRCGPDGGS